MKINEWIELYGEQAVEELARRIGGRRLYIPVRADLHADVIAALGDQAEEFKWRHQGLRVEIPAPLTVQREISLRRARDSARRLITNGLSTNTIIKATGLGRSTIDALRSDIQ